MHHLAIILLQFIVPNTMCIFLSNERIGYFRKTLRNNLLNILQQLDEYFNIDLNNGNLYIKKFTCTVYSWGVLKKAANGFSAETNSNQTIATDETVSTIYDKDHCVPFTVVHKIIEIGENRENGLAYKWCSVNKCNPKVGFFYVYINSYHTGTAHNVLY